MNSASFIAAEQQQFETEVAAVETWWKSERFSAVTRSYSAKDVVMKRGSLPETHRSNLAAKKLWALLKKHQAENTASRTY